MTPCDYSGCTQPAVTCRTVDSVVAHLCDVHDVAVDLGHLYQGSQS